MNRLWIAVPRLISPPKLVRESVRFRSLSYEHRWCSREVITGSAATGSGAGSSLTAWATSTCSFGAG